MCKTQHNQEINVTNNVKADIQKVTMEAQTYTTLN